MKIIIDTIDFSDYMNNGSLKIRYYGSYKSDCSLILEFRGKIPFPLKAGTEIKIYGEGSILIWGGVVRNLICKYRSSDFVSVSVSGQGYESVFSHRAVYGVTSSFGNVMNAMHDVYTRVLSDEGISFASATPSIARTMTPNILGAVSASEYIDYISNYYGVVWRIDKNKIFSYSEGYPVKRTSFSLDLNGAFADGVYEAAVSESIEDYRNTQYISIKDGYSKKSDTNGILAMKKLFGSGLYEKVTKNFNVTDTAHGGELAQKILNNFSEIPKFIKFIIRDKEFSLFDGIKVKGGVTGDVYSDYVVVSVDVSYAYGTVVSSVICRCFSGNNYIPLANQTGKLSFNI